MSQLENGDPARSPEPEQKVKPRLRKIVNKILGYLPKGNSNLAQEVHVVEAIHHKESRNLSEQWDSMQGQLAELFKQAEGEWKAIEKTENYIPPSGMPKNEQNFNFIKYVKYIEQFHRANKLTEYDSDKLRLQLFAELENMLPSDSAHGSLLQLYEQVTSELPESDKVLKMFQIVIRITFKEHFIQPVFDGEFLQKLMKVVLWNDAVLNWSSADERDDVGRKLKGFYLLVRWLVTGKVEEEQEYLMKVRQRVAKL